MHMNCGTWNIRKLVVAGCARAAGAAITGDTIAPCDQYDSTHGRPNIQRFATIAMTESASGTIATRQ